MRWSGAPKQICEPIEACTSDPLYSDHRYLKPTKQTDIRRDQSWDRQPPVAGPFCATASELPATSSAAAIVKLFRVAIIVLSLEAAHPGCAKERPDEAARSGVSNPLENSVKSP
jgi:hypothetical protein